MEAHNDNLKDILTKEDKSFIIDNYNKMSVIQMAIRLNIKTENRKCPIITEFIRLSNLKNKTESQKENVPVEIKVESQPPPTIEEKVGTIVAEDVVKEVFDDEPIEELASVEAFANQLKEYHIRIRDPLSEREIIDIKFLMHQMQATRFVQIVQTFRRKEYKKLFQEEFIRSMYGKGEMPQEEVNDFIDICEALVYQHDCRCKIKELEKILDDKDLPKEKRVGIIQVQKDLHSSISEASERIGTKKKGLGTLREQRMKDTRNTGLTLSALFESFYDSEKREHLLNAQDKYNKDLMDALEKIDTLEESKALIMGISKDELRLGAS